jgi:hypothetical protein
LDGSFLQGKIDQGGDDSSGLRSLFERRDKTPCHHNPSDRTRFYVFIFLAEDKAMERVQIHFCPGAE